jgi:hypothetical protein
VFRDLKGRQGRLLTVPIPGKLCVADSAIYLIRLLGLVDARWAATLGEMGIVTHERDTDRDITTLCGRVTDQAALLGILNLVHGLGTQLLSVEYLPDGQN